jgi:translation elongation factor EF-Tu-like GTPase
LAEELRKIAEEEAAASNVAPIASNKPHINVVSMSGVILWQALVHCNHEQVFIGHVDHGKSTMSGAILLACGMVNTRDVEKLQKDAEAAGRVSSPLCFRLFL